ncbi:MAG: hypothetical protein RTV72_14720 [Candidatus Thorarchaeota archaeon]
MERPQYHKFMYTIAAIWNWILSVAFLILPRIDMGIFSIAGPVAPPPTLLWFDSLFGLVFAFGLIAYLIGNSTTQNQGLIKIAIFEKFWVFVIGVYYFLIFQASFLVVAVVSGDLLLGLLFLEDLIAIRKS